MVRDSNIFEKCPEEGMLRKDDSARYAEMVTQETTLERKSEGNTDHLEGKGGVSEFGEKNYPSEFSAYSPSGQGIRVAEDDPLEIEANEIKLIKTNSNSG